MSHSAQHPRYRPASTKPPLREARHPAPNSLAAQLPQQHDSAQTHRHSRATKDPTAHEHQATFQAPTATKIQQDRSHQATTPAQNCPSRTAGHSPQPATVQNYRDVQQAPETPPSPLPHPGQESDPQTPCVTLHVPPPALDRSASILPPRPSVPLRQASPRSPTDRQKEPPNHQTATTHQRTSPQATRRQDKSKQSTQPTPTTLPSSQTTP